jgi:hypothetical protein
MNRLPVALTIWRNDSPRCFNCSSAPSTAAASPGRSQAPKASARWAGGALAHDGGIALEARLALAAVPAHQELALRAHEKGRQIVRALQGGQLPPQAPLDAGGAPLLAQQHHGGGGGEGHEAHEEAERGGVVKIELAQEIQDACGPSGQGQGELGRLGGPGGAREKGGSGQEGEGQGRPGRAGRIARLAAIAVPTLPKPGHAVGFLPQARQARWRAKCIHPRRRPFDATRVIPPTHERNCRPGPRNRSTAGRIASTLDHARLHQKEG